MILKCSKCDGMMKVDENIVPKAENFKVRCPHCGEIDTVPHPTFSDPNTENEAREPAPIRQDSPPLQQTTELEPASSGDNKPEGAEPSLPSDAFGRFRFPAEKEAKDKPKEPMGRRARILVWAGLSAAVVVLFALLVNLLLPGPAAQSTDLGFVPPAMESPDGSGSADRLGKPR